MVFTFIQCHQNHNCHHLDVHGNDKRLLLYLSAFMDIVNYQSNDFITEVNNMGNQRTQPSVTLLHAKLG